MPEYDIVIKGGTIVDGLQRPRYKADVGIRKGRIVRIGSVRASDGARVIDAAGLIVAPGFVDCHTHYDSQIQWDPWCTMSSWHGVTSVVLGNCGFGFAPCRPEDQDRSMQMMERNEAIAYAAMKEGMLWDWVTFPDWMNTLDRIPKGVNCVSLVPLNPVMVWAMGLEATKERGATEAERKAMQQIVHEGMDAGALGWSVQRLGENSAQGDVDGTPMPTDTMTDEDCLAFADVLRERGGGIMQVSQFKDLGDMTAEADLEFQRLLAERSGGALFHNSVFAIDENPEFHRSRLAWLDRCAKQGLNIYAQAQSVRFKTAMRMDRFNFLDVFPGWREATVGSVEDRIAKMGDPARRQTLRDELDLHEMGSDIGVSVIGGTFAELTIASHGNNPDLIPLVGRTLADVARERGVHVADALIDVSIEGGLDVELHSSETLFGRDPDLMAEILNHPAVVPGQSDGGAHTKFFTGASYGTDYLAWLVRDQEKATLEHAHYKLGYLSAQFAGIKDRGFILEGAPADLVVYDLENLKRVPEWTYEVRYDQPANEWRRVQTAEGYRYTLVNGEVTFEDGECTQATPGELLRHGSAS